MSWESSGTRDAWADYYASPVPPDGTNWAAYSHEELHQMLWQEADVADVSTVADEWRQQSVAMAEHASALRDQQSVLRSNWQGAAAEVAAGKLGTLADRLDEISAGAAAGQRAAQDAGDALALARAMMPPPVTAPAAFAPPAFTPPAFTPMAFAPPPNPMVLPTAPSMPAYGTNSAPGFYMTFGAPPSGMGTAFDSVATGGTSMYYSNLAAEQAKSQAVYTMRVYESSLADGGREIATHAAGTQGGFPAMSQVVGESPKPGGVPWDRLVGADQLRPGLAVGVGVNAPSSTPLPHGGLPQEAMAARAAGHGGMVPSVGPRTGADDDEQHENQMPTIDQGLFTVETPTSAPVIGLIATGVNQ